MPEWLNPLPIPPVIETVVVITVFLAGLCVGSFANVMGLRLLAGKPLTHPPSHCPICKTPLRWYHNIPVLSYIGLRAQCHACATPISVQYPLIELLTGVLFVMVYYQAGLGVGGLLLALLILNLVSIIITDLKESLIYHLNSLGLIPLGLLFNLLRLDGGAISLTSWPDVPLADTGLLLPGPFLSALAGVVAGFLLFEGAILLSQWCFGTEGFGHGDTYLLMGVAAFLGWELAIVVFVLGLVLQGLLAFPMLIWQWLSKKQYATLAIALGAAVAALGPSLLQHWVSLPAGLNLILFLAGTVIALVLMVLFLKRIREAQQFTYMPLGPALVLATLWALFYGQATLSPLLKSLPLS